MNGSQEGGRITMPFDAPMTDWFRGMDEKSDLLRFHVFALALKSGETGWRSLRSGIRTEAPDDAGRKAGATGAVRRQRLRRRGTDGGRGGGCGLGKSPSMHDKVDAAGTGIDGATLGFPELSFYNNAGQAVIEKTDYTVGVGGSSLAMEHAEFRIAP
jgi:hypothetical protein